MSLLPSRPIRAPVWLGPLTRRRGEASLACCPVGPSSRLSDTEADLLARLDGALPSHRPSAGGQAGVGPAPWRALLGTGRPRRLTDQAHDPQRPAGAMPRRVVVDGRGHVASTSPTPCAGRHDGRARSGRGGPGGRAPSGRRPDLVALIGSPVVDPRRGDLWLRHGVPQLPVAPAGPRTVVGPLVDGSPLAPCLWCLDLHRATATRPGGRDEPGGADPDDRARRPAGGTARRPRRPGPSSPRHRLRHAARHRVLEGHPPRPGVCSRWSPVAVDGRPSLADTAHSARRTEPAAPRPAGRHARRGRANDVDGALERGA